MSTKKWFNKNTCSLKGKTVAVTGATGGLGGAICRYLLELSADLVLLNRNPAKTKDLCEKLKKEYPMANIEFVQVDMCDINSVKRACAKLKNLPLDILVHNAGAYDLPRKKSSSGFDNVFQINFVSPYFMTKELLPLLNKRKGKVVAVGSIAHAFVKTDIDDVDFSNYKRASHVYGNSKRYLIYGLSELVKENPGVQLSIAHPGISFTNITSNYPKFILKIIKWPMKIIFMKPEMAAKSIIMGICNKVDYLNWIGPKYFNIWGNPKIKKLNTCDERERIRIFKTAESIYEKLANEE